MKRPAGAALAVSVISTVLVASGCATNLSGSGLPTSSSSVSLAPITADQALFANLPARVQSNKKLVVGTSPTYKPVEFLEGEKVSGLDIDLFDAVGERLGVEVEWKQSQFDQILIGIQAKKYDAGVSAFTVTPERTKTVNMVSYLSAGSLWTVQKGNPKKVEAGKPCGLTVAVQTGVVQEMEMKAAQSKCGDNKINLLSFSDQGEATAALVTGRAQVMAADSPIALYAAKMNEGTIEQLGEPYDAAPYGAVVRKEDAELADAMKDALEDLKESGHYDAILAKWNQNDGAIDAFEVNPS